MNKQYTLRQRGMAIIAALVVVVAASVLATAIIERQGLLANTLISESNRVQATWVMKGGLDWARAVLQMDARENPVTRLDALWARPVIGLPVGNAEDPEHALFSGQIEDEQGKYNLQNLADNGKINPDQVRVLERLLGWLGLETSLALAMAQRIADAQPGQAEGPRAVGLRTIDDLRTLPGISVQTLDALQPYLTVLPATTTLNVNTTTAEVLGAVVNELGLAGARDLIIQRDQGLWFANRADFVNRLHGQNPDAGQRIGVSSHWFRVTGEVVVGDSLISLRALVHRNDQGLPSIRWATDQ